MSANATATRSGTITFFAYSNGDGSTTFNLPNHRGVYFAGRTNMGGSTSSNLTLTYLGTLPTQLGASGGVQSTTLTALNLPPYTPSGSIANGAITITQNANTQNSGASVQAGANPGIVTNAAATISASQATSTFTGAAQGGTSTAFSRIPPTSIINYAIRLIP
jgi:microcystin-dependent protein